MILFTTHWIRTQETSSATPFSQPNLSSFRWYRVTAAQRRFSKEFDTELKESTVRTWKTKYLAETSLKTRSGEGDISVTNLTVKKRGRGLMLGEKHDEEVKHYIKAVRDGHGVITILQ